MAVIRIPGPGGNVTALPTSFAYISGSVTGCGINATGTVCKNALNYTPSAKDLIVCSAYWADSGSVTGTWSSSNNTWTSVPPGKVAGTGGIAGFSSESFYTVAAAGADTITFTISSSAASFAMGWECTAYTYTGTINGFDGTAVLSTKTASGGVSTTDTVTTSGSSSLLFGTCPAVAQSCSVGTGYTSRNDTLACGYNGTSCTSTFNMNSVTGFLLEDKVGVSSGSQTATFGVSSGDAIIGLIGF